MKNEVNEVELTLFWSEAELNLWREHDEHGDLDFEARLAFSLLIAIIFAFTLLIVVHVKSVEARTQNVQRVYSSGEGFYGYR